MILQTIHKYRRTLVGVTFMLLIGLSLSGLGVNAFHSFVDERQGNYAIKVNEREISFPEFTKISRLSRQDPQRTVDRLVSAAVLEQSASAMGFNSGEDVIKHVVTEEIFRGNFSPELYQGFLQQMGVSAAEFEKGIREDALRGQLTQLLGDVSFASDRETRIRLELDDTKYSADYLEFKPESYLEAAPAPSEEEISTYYNENSGDFEVAAAVAYDYVPFTPEEYEKSVEVSPDDIELHYADNETQFATPESVKARHIRFLYPKDAKPEQMAELKERANQAFSRAKAGESFEALALEFSDDGGTKTDGGDLGWLTRGKMSKEFDAAAFKLKGAGLADLIEADYGFQIVRVDEYKPSGTKPLAEVKDQIVQEIQKRDAPLYAANRAAEQFEEWKKSNLSLAEFASQRGLKAASTSGLLTQDMDPETPMKGLTAAVLPAASQQKQLVDIDEKSALVQVTRSREADIAPLAEVKEKIVAKLKLASAKQLARKDAGAAIDEIKKGTFKTLAEYATAKKMNKASASGMTRAKPSQGIFAEAPVKRAVVSTFKPNDPPSQVFDVGGSFWLVQVTEIVKPSPEETEKKLPSSKSLESNRIASNFIESYVNQVKKVADIQVNPQALAQVE